MSAYLWYCKKCESYVESTFSIGRSRQQAWDAGMQDKVKHHDLEQHAFDMALPSGKVVRFGPVGRKGKR